MANDKQYAILRKGVEFWNKWREENPDVHIDMSNVELPRVDLSLHYLKSNPTEYVFIGINLSEADLSGANLVATCLINANLTGANLSGANLWGADLRGANLSRAVLKGVNLRKASLMSASLVEVDLSKTDLHKFDLDRVDLSGANLSEADLSGATFHWAKLNRAKLVGADLREASLPMAELNEADLSWAELQKAYLRGAKLTGAKLIGTNLREADLREVKLTGAKLIGTDLRGASYDAETLREADLKDAKLDDEPVKRNEEPEIACQVEYPNNENPNIKDNSEKSTVEDDVSFTAIIPRECSVETWHTLLVYAHLQSAIEDVHKDAQRFKDQIPMQKEISTRASSTIVYGSEITIIPSCDSLVFNPKYTVFTWLENFNRVDFRFRADKSLINDAARGEINIYAGPILVGTLKFAMLLNDTDAVSQDVQEEHVKMYRQEDIFVSYSHKDTEVVLACRNAYEALGFNVLIDIDTLRSGQDWNEELMNMIDRATIFQLFWSKNSSQSVYCQQEWKHALQRNKEDFIRPVYWTIPMPEPPEELSKYHFDYVPF